jgi:hypothetical protein
MNVNKKISGPSGLHCFDVAARVPLYATKRSNGFVLSFFALAVGHADCRLNASTQCGLNASS